MLSDTGNSHTVVIQSHYVGHRLTRHIRPSWFLIDGLPWRLVTYVQPGYFFTSINVCLGVQNPVWYLQPGLLYTTTIQYNCTLFEDNNHSDLIKPTNQFSDPRTPLDLDLSQEPKASESRKYQVQYNDLGGET